MTEKKPDKRIKWSPGREDRFKDYLDYEIAAALFARASLENKWAQWLTQYRPAATQPTKHFPFEGAANHVMPVTAIDVDQLFAKFVQTLHAPPNFWTIEALNPDWTDAAKPIQDFMQWLDGTLLKMEKVNKRAILEMVKLGTCIYKVDWLYETRPKWDYDGNGGRVRTLKTISRPVVDHVRLIDFLIPPDAYEIQPDDQDGAQWVAERHRIEVARLESIADSAEPYMPNYGTLAVQKIKNWLAPATDTMRDTVAGLDYQQPNSGGRGQSFEITTAKATDHAPSGNRVPQTKVEFWEVHARYATQGTSEDDIVVEYHIPTRTIIRGIYNRFHHGKRPYERAVYFPSDGFYGIGVCEQKEVFQDLESMLINYTEDNVLLGNSIGLAAKQGSNIAPGEPIYPSKIWITDGSPKEELMPFQLGAGAYPGLDGLRESYSYMGRQRTGVSDLNSGNISTLPSRTPATTVQSLLEEGARRPDLTLKDIRRCLSEVGLRIIQLIQQHAQPMQNADGEKVLQAALSVLGNDAGLEVVRKLGLPLEGAEYGLGVSLTATNATANKEMAKQSYMGLIQLKMQVAPLYVQTMQMAMQAWGTPIGQVALDNLQALSFLEKRLFEQFDMRNMNDLVTQVPKDPVQAISDPTAALQFLPPSSGSPQGADPASGMAPPGGAPPAGGPAGV